MVNKVGAHPSDRAGGLRPEPAVQSQPEALIPCADGGAIWRCGVSDTIGAVDILLREWKSSRRKALREAAAEMDAYLQRVHDLRMGHDPLTYRDAFEAGKALHASAMEARRAETGTGSVHDSAIIATGDETPNLSGEGRDGTA